MHKNRKKAVAAIYVIVLLGLTCPIEAQFIEWILSLISQRPPSPTQRPSAAPPVTEAPAPIAPVTPPVNCQECVCGVANKKKRIVGGQETVVNQYPWIALLLYKNRFYCAASLINDRYVVTASHCVHGFKIENITVRLLDHSRSSSDPKKIDRKVERSTEHPKYSTRTFDSDIALVRLSEPVEIKGILRPVCLPTPGKHFAGETGIVAGWGATVEGGPISDTLQEVHVPILSQENCRSSKYGASRITDNMLCAGYDDGNRDSCQGDSGGPLHIVNGDEHQIVGIVSWGEGCAKPSYPGVYTRVNRFGTWIRGKTKDACHCRSEVKKV